MDKNNISCPLCKSKYSVKFLIGAQDRLNPLNKYDYKRCLKCNLVFLEDRRENYNFEAYNIDKKVSKSQKFVYSLFYRRLRKIRKNGKLLDFGSGSGNLAKFLSMKGYDVSCYEVDKNYIDHLKNVQNLKVIKSLDKSDHKKYDIVIMEQVIEHLVNPLESLKLIKNILKNEGFAIVTIPNINSMQARIFGKKWFHLDAPRHLTHFYKDSFQQMILNSGFKIVKRHYFNLHIDPSGWYWSIKRPSKNPSLLGFGMFLPIVLINSIFKNTGYIMYILKKNE